MKGDQEMKADVVTIKNCPINQVGLGSNFFNHLDYLGYMHKKKLGDVETLKAYDSFEND